MTPNLLDELEKIVALSEKATPGKVELHTSCSWRRIMAESGRGFLVPGIDPDRHPNMDSIENAQFVVALVNWFRTHHAEIAAAVRDSQRIDWLADPENKIGNVQLPSECVMANLHSLRAAIDAAMRAGEGEG